MGDEMFTCTNTNNEVRQFATYDEAYRFVMREGDASRLWTIDGAFALLMSDRRAAKAAAMFFAA